MCQFLTSLDGTSSGTRAVWIKDKEIFMHDSASSNSIRFAQARWILALACTAGSVMWPAGLFAQQPMLIPAPRELQTSAQSFKGGTNLQIVLLSSLTREDVVSAENVQEELKLVTGQEYPITTSPEPPKDIPAIILGRFSQPAMQSLLAAQHLGVEGVGDQGYILDVEPNRVVLAGKDAAGLFYGAQTLRQLVVSSGQEAAIEGVRIRDWPSLQFRGTMVDASRGSIPRLSYLKQIVRMIAQFKMNQLSLYIKGPFQLEGQPFWGLLSDSLTRPEWEELVAYAGRYYVEIVPITESCGHLHEMMRFEQYSGLAERPHGEVLAPDDPRGLDLMKNMYEQMLPVFPSSIYNIGCDETFELGKGRSKEMVKDEGYGKVYADNLIRVAKLVESYNKQVMFWGDIAVKHPEMISNLPKNLIVASWEYGAHKSYEPWLKPFQSAGMRFFVCPWVGNTNVMVPDYEEAAYNIGHFLSEGKQAGAIGTIITVWNDDGETLFAPGWWSVVYGAANAWEPGESNVQEFNRKYDWAFYRNTDHRFADAIMSLGHINEIMRAGKEVQTYDMRSGGANDALFWRGLLSPTGRKEAEKELPVASQIRQTAENAYTVLTNGASRAKRNADTLESLRFAALRLDALGMRYQYLEEISERYRDAVASEKRKDLDAISWDFYDIDAPHGRLQDLRDYTTRLTELYRDLWLSENPPNWLPNILQLYEGNSRYWQTSIAKYSEIRSAQRSQDQPLPSPESLGLLTGGPSQ